MHVVHIVTRLNLGGAERNIRAAIDLELDRGYSVDLVVGEMSPTFRQTLQKSVAITVVPSLQRKPSLWRDLLAFVFIRNFLKRRDPDVVHTHYSKAGIIGRLAIPNGRHYAVAHTVHMSNFGSGYRRIESVLYKSLERLCARRTDVLCFVGVELRDSYERAKIKARGPSIVLRSPIEVEPYLEVRRDETASTRPARPVDVCMVGTLEVRKRHALVLSMLATSLREGKYRLTIVGDGPERSSLERQAVDLDLRDAVSFTGYIDDVPRIMASSRALILASTAEGVPQVVIQALAAGLPVVATKVDGLREIQGANVRVVSHDGSNLEMALASAVGEPNVPVDADLFSSWSASAVNEDYRRFLESMRAISIRRGPVK